MKKNLNDIVFFLNEFKEVYHDDAQKCIKWITSIKDKVQPQQYQRWSEEDEIIRNEIVLFLREGKPYYCSKSVKRQEWSNWLKSLKHRWKSSEEQMRAVFDASERNDKMGSVLRNLYDDLRKL